MTNLQNHIQVRVAAIRAGLEVWSDRLRQQPFDAIFWSAQFINWVLAYFSWIEARTIIGFIIGFLLLMLPFTIWVSSTYYKRSERPVTATFFLLTACFAALAGTIILLLHAPLTLLISPSQLTEPKDLNPGSPIMLYLVSKTYSLFDILTLLGTMATLTLVWAGIHIPDEARIQERNNELSKALLDAHIKLTQTAHQLLLEKPNSGNALRLALQFQEQSATLTLLVGERFPTSSIPATIDQLRSELNIEDFIAPGSTSNNSVVSKSKSLKLIDELSKQLAMIKSALR